MKSEKDIKSQIAFVKYLTKYLFYLVKFPFMKQNEIFTNIYNKNIWGNKKTVSGHGSTLEHTETILEELPKIIQQFKVKTILDIPCGDLYWMKNINFDINYIGADIVKNLIEENCKKFPDFGEFLTLDICSSKLPECDLIFCRDCLVHLSFKNIFLALNNIKDCNCKYLMMTTFPELKSNSNTITGAWRALNFQIPPFNFPEPIKLVQEKPIYRGKRYPDKALGLWEMNSLNLKHLN